MNRCINLFAFSFMVKEGERQEHKEAARETQAVIDRIEDDGVAVLLVGEGGKTQVDIPASLLPDGASGGDHLRITITVDSASRGATERGIKELQEQLKEQSGTKDKKDFKL
jgi:hypothetical protein